jgi:hypothetical protein
MSGSGRSAVHTSHDTHGYLISAWRVRILWAPEYWDFPAWAAGADPLYADAASWRRPIRFARKVGGHEAALASASEVRRVGTQAGRLRSFRTSDPGAPSTPVSSHPSVSSERKG